MQWTSWKNSLFGNWWVDAGSARGGGRGPALAWHPVESGRGVGVVGRSLVLQADPAAVPGGLEVGELAVEGEIAGAGGAAAGCVGDLHVRDATRGAGVGRDDLVDVVTVDGQVVKVGQHAKICRTAD